MLLYAEHLKRLRGERRIDMAFLNRISFTALLIFIMISSPALAAKQESFAAYEAAVMESFSRGDYYQLYDSIERLLLNYYNKPETYLYYSDLYRLKDVHGYERVSKTIRSIMRAIEGADGLSGRNSCLIALKLELEKVLYRIDRKQAERLSGELHPVRTWRVFGPYFKFGIADMDYPFLPELTTSIDNLDLKGKKVYLKKPSGVLDCKRYLYPHKEIAYAVTTLQVAHPVKLRIYSTASYKLFVNGKEVLRNIRGELYRRYRVVRVWGTDNISVMMKMSGSHSWSFRLIITDDDDTIIEPKVGSEELVFSDFQFLEELDYPYEHLVKEARENPVRGFNLLGTYFDELDSTESIRYYRESVRRRYDPVRQYFLASAMIEYSYGEKDSELYMEGWRIIDELARKYDDFMPAQYRRFKRLIEGKNFQLAYSLGERLYTESKLFFPFRMVFINLMRSLGYEKEFTEHVSYLARDFPHSVEPVRFLASYSREKNVSDSIAHYRRILQSAYDEKALLSLIEVYYQQGDYDAAVKVIGEFDHDGSFTKHLVDVLIDRGDFKRAKRIIFKELLNRDDPYYYYKLGEMSYKRDLDPSMYWEKLLAVDPSYFNIGEFLEYIQDGKLSHPLAKYCDYRVEDAIISALLHKREGTGSHIIFRSRIYKLNRDGSSRAFFEEVIEVKDQQSIDRWGEYRVPSRGELYPVRVRVYHADGSFTDSYRIEKINGDYYINISSLRVGSIIHLAYYLDFPIVEPRRSSFFSVPFTIIQDYNEPVSSFLLRVIAPREIDIHFCFNRGVKVSRSFAEDQIIHTATLDNLDSIHEEGFSGNKLNHLPFYSFTSMRDLKEFVVWYNGLLRGAFDLDDEIEKFKGGDIRGTLQRVYSFVAHEIELLNNVLYYPEKSRNIAFRKSGSAEDKVILAKSILDRIGIRSYIAFTREQYFPDIGGYIAPAMFTRILLYVPLDKKNEIWMDFSNQFYPCGHVDEGVNNADAVILVGNNYEIKEVRVPSVHKRTGQYKVSLDPLGNAEVEINLSFSGSAGQIRELFKTVYIEDAVCSYVGRIVPSISIDAFKINNQDTNEKPLHIWIEGEGYSLATIGKNMLMLQPIINKCNVYYYIRDNKRKLPLLIVNPIEEEEEYRYILPAHFRAVSVDEEYEISDDYGVAKIVLKKDRGIREMIVRKKIFIKKQLILPEAYSDFLDFCMKIKTMENRNVILSR